MSPLSEPASYLGRMTARELLVYMGGDTHALHSVASREPAEGGYLRFTCSCGKRFMCSATAKHKDALRNVPETAGGAR